MGLPRENCVCNLHAFALGAPVSKESAWTLAKDGDYEVIQFVQLALCAQPLPYL